PEVGPVPLRAAGAPVAIIAPGDVRVLAGGEGLDGHLLAQRVLAGVGGPQLDQVPPWRHTGLAEVAGQRPVDLPRIDRAVRQLHGRVPVAIRGAHLGDHARPGLHHGDRDDLVVVPDLGHAELGAQDALYLPVHLYLSARVAVFPAGTAR